MKKYLSAFVCGFGAGVLQIVPVAKSFSCCLIIPVAAYFALILEQRANNNFDKIESTKAITFGAVTGLYAALFGSIFEILITFITKNNDIIAGLPEFQNLINNLPGMEQIKSEVIDLLERVVNELRESGFSWFYTFAVIVNNFVLNTIFGIIGGLIGAQIINSRKSGITPPK